MPATAGTTAEYGETTGLSSLHPDILKSHVLARLDAPALASAACCSTALRRVSSSEDLWSSICRTTWPSTASSSLTDFVSTFPDGGVRAFYSHAFPILADRRLRRRRRRFSTKSPPPPPESIISAVDIHHKEKLFFSKVLETETASKWFRFSPFRIDLLSPKDAVPTLIKNPADTIDDMMLSWILIDPIARRAANVSSHKPVTVHRHWLTGEVKVRYASILAVDRAAVEVRITVTCGAGAGESEGGAMQVREITLELEDMDGMQLNGEDSLVFLQEALEGKKGTGKNRVEEGQRRYEEYVEMTRRRKESKMRTEQALDVFCGAFAATITFIAFSWFILVCAECIIRN